MAGNNASEEIGVSAATPMIANLRTRAQQHLAEIEIENSRDAHQEAIIARDLEKYTKVRRKNRQKQTLPTPVETKKGKLRSAQDVLDRLRHDPSFDLAKYHVGYLERFEGIKEMPVMLWIAESTDEDWIPQHRIKYFKRVNEPGTEEIVWDRENRIDKIFGSGGAMLDDGETSEIGGVVLDETSR